MKSSLEKSKLHSVAKEPSWLKDYWRKNRKWILNAVIKLVIEFVRRFLSG